MKPIALALLGISLLAGRSPAAEKVEYRGFTIQPGKIKDKEAVVASAKLQVDQILKIKLPDEVLAAFRKVPIALEDNVKDEFGRYDDGKVTLKARIIPADRPILLHELLHAYHHRVLPEGTRNPKVIDFYRRARQRYPEEREKGEYFLSNPNEYFAVTASIFLYGSIKRAPYDRKTIRERQPLYDEYLESLFGPRPPEG